MTLYMCGPFLITVILKLGMIFSCYVTPQLITTLEKIHLSVTNGKHSALAHPLNYTAKMRALNVHKALKTVAKDVCT